MHLQIESARQDFHKETFRNKLKETLLVNSDCGWTIEIADKWEDAYITMPLTRLLDVDDQAKVIQDFVQKGLNDLERIGLTAIIQSLE